MGHWIAQVEIGYTATNCDGVAFIKKTPTLDSMVPLGKQLHAIVLSDASPFETIHA